MRIKKFVANSMPEAMKLIKEDLGNKAIILNSKKVKSPGLLGLFRRKQIEVTAMLDDEINIASKPREAKEKKINPVAPITYKKNLDEKRILDEIKHLQSIMAEQTIDKETNFPPMLQSVYKYLIDQEVDQDKASNLVKTLLNELEKGNSDRETIDRLLHEKVESQFAEITYTNIEQGTKLIQMVGPTGVGKTTTIAKIAAKYILNKKKTVAFITADTYRIAAIEQLKTYATILNVPLEVVYSKEDYEKALHKFENYDLIFVDTAGRNYRDDRYINELKEFISTSTYPSQTFLVLSLTAKAADITGVYQQFKKLNINQVIFTKLDETESYGNLYNLLVNGNLDIVYLTNGQNVPDDLVKPTAKKLTHMLLSGYQNG